MPDKRFLSYIEVQDYHYTYNDNNSGAAILWAAMWWCPITWIVTPFMKGSSEVEFGGDFKIYIYDSEKKEIVYSKLVVVDEKEKYKGNYSLASEETKEKMNDYYDVILFNALLDEYSRAYNYISNLK